MNTYQGYQFTGSEWVALLADAMITDRLGFYNTEQPYTVLDRQTLDNACLWLSSNEASGIKPNQDAS